jgi:sugar/nucleoside kinase (ribokinase family)
MDSQAKKITPDYLILGHISKDLTQDGSRPGGTALYSGILAQRMGLEVAMITSCEELPELEDIAAMEIINFPAETNTTFRNIYSSDGRKQYITSKALDLDYSSIPKNWKKTRILHFGSIAREIILPDEYPTSLESSIAYSLQGWLRKWDNNGVISPAKLEDRIITPRNQFVGFLSLEDLGSNLTQLNRLREMFPLLILTKGKDGAEIYQGEELINIPPESVNEVDSTGAGDIFAAGFMIYWVIRGRSIREAGIMAGKLAALSVTRHGLEGIPTIAEIQKIEQN